jgi:hypothetical protein
MTGFYRNIIKGGFVITYINNGMACDRKTSYWHIGRISNEGTYFVLIDGTYASGVNGNMGECI